MFTQAVPVLAKGLAALAEITLVLDPLAANFGQDGVDLRPKKQVLWLDFWSGWWHWSSWFWGE
ncbi:MAG: hypothetical protein ACI9VR_005080 [Cognaticolwellia sp.]|jgi:hypothetical protein